MTVVDIPLMVLTELSLLLGSSMRAWPSSWLLSTPGGLSPGGSNGWTWRTVPKGASCMLVMPP